MDNVNDLQEKPKKKKSGLKKFLVFIVIVVIIVIALGFLFPGLLWSRNLNISYTKADYDSMINKLQYLKDFTPAGESADEYTYQYGELKNIHTDFTSAEITSFVNENRPSYYPLKNVQVKINTDGTIEAVGSANVDYFLTNVLSGKYSKEQIKDYLPALGMLPDNVNLYIKFTGSVINDKSNVSLQSASVQGVPIPSNIINSNEAVSVVTGGLDTIIASYKEKSGASFDKIAVEDGNLEFQGDVPSSLERIKK